MWLLAHTGFTEAQRLAHGSIWVEYETPKRMDEDVMKSCPACDPESCVANDTNESWTMRVQKDGWILRNG
jgi:hypothetical protein